jgi:hypothetical protein
MEWLLLVCTFTVNTSSFLFPIYWLLKPKPRIYYGYGTRVHEGKSVSPMTQPFHIDLYKLRYSQCHPLPFSKFRYYIYERAQIINLKL